jgi:NitT/TauT family transport system permease protein
MITGTAHLRRVALGVAGLLTFLLLWKATESFEWVRRGTMPDPLLVPAAAMDEWRSGRFLPAIGSSLVHYVWGLGLGTVMGFIIGALAATIRPFDDFQRYIARVLRPIPPLAWVVFAIAWFQVSHAGAAFVISIGVFWVNYFATYTAVQNVDPRYYELAKAFGQGGYLARSMKVTLPAAMPGGMGGCANRCWTGLDDVDRSGIIGRAGAGSGDEFRCGRWRL